MEIMFNIVSFTTFNVFGKGTVTFKLQTISLPFHICNNLVTFSYI